MSSERSKEPGFGPGTHIVSQVGSSGCRDPRLSEGQEGGGLEVQKVGELGGRTATSATWAFATSTLS